MKHLWMSQMKHRWMSQMKHLWMSQMKRLWMSQMKHRWMSQMKHRWMSQMKHLWMSQMKHLWMSQMKHLWMSQMKHLWMSIISSVIWRTLITRHCCRCAQVYGIHSPNTAAFPSDRCPWKLQHWDRQASHTHATVMSSATQHVFQLECDVYEALRLFKTLT